MCFQENSALTLIPWGSLNHEFHPEAGDMGHGITTSTGHWSQRAAPFPALPIP